MLWRDGISAMIKICVKKGALLGFRHTYVKSVDGKLESRLDDCERSD